MKLASNLPQVRRRDEGRISRLVKEVKKFTAVINVLPQGEGPKAPQIDLRDLLIGFGGKDNARIYGNILLKFVCLNEGRTKAQVLFMAKLPKVNASARIRPEFSEISRKKQ
ncbi:MAG: hypothetical protein KC587_18785 [Nitrospira sp.]|nr:hypothetical protein [Nitrospira sp.]